MRVSRWLVAWLLTGTACSTASDAKDVPARSPEARDGGAAAGLFFAPSPGDAGPVDEDADLGIACSDAAPRFGTEVAPILAGCAGGELCHGFAAPPALYGQLVGAPAYDGCDAGVLVTPGSLPRSYLLHKVTGIAMCANTQRMPPGGAVSPADIQTIADWICAGAPND
jgi:hypothetical protein